MFKKNRWQKLALIGAFIAMAGTNAAMAADPTDIGGVITELGVFKTGAIALGVALLLWTLGRRLVRKAT